MLLWKISDCPGVSAAPAAYFLSLAVDVAWILLLRVFHVMHKSYAKFLEFLIQSQSVGIWLSNSIFDCKYLSNLPAYIFSCGLHWGRGLFRGIQAGQDIGFTSANFQAEYAVLPCCYLHHGN